MAGNDIRWNLELAGEKKVQKGLKDTGDAAEKAGDQLHDMGDDAGFVSKQVKEATDNIKRLSAELDKTGNKSLLKDIDAEQRRLNKFSRIAKNLPTGGASDAAGSLVALSPPQLKAAAAGAGAAVAPLIGGAVSAAVLGAVGAGGIIGGIALAADDPAVQDASAKLAANVSAAFTGTGAAFVQPTVDALDTLATTGVKAADALQPGMAELAGTVDDLATGLDGLVENALPGAAQALKASVPVVRFLAKELPDLGESVGNFLSKVSSDPDGAILALGTLIDLLQEGVEGAGNIVAGLSAIYEGSARAAEGVSGFMSEYLGWLPLTGDIYTDQHEKIKQTIAKLDAAKTSTDELSTSTERVTYRTYGLGAAADDAAGGLERERAAMQAVVDLELERLRGTISVERAIDDLVETRKENGKSLDIEAEAGRRNTEQIVQGIEAVRAGAEAEYKLAMQHGATAEEAERAAKAYRDKYGKELEAQIIRLYGNTAAVQALLAELKKLDGKSFTYTVIQKGSKTIGHKVDGGVQLAGDEGVYHRASGGPFRKGPSYIVGEHGPELVEFDGGGKVYNATQTRAMMSGSAAMPPIQITLGLAPAPNMPQNMTDLARILIPYFQIVIPEFGASVEDAMGIPQR